MSRLYARLLLWFCVANIVTLLVSVFVTERLARVAYASDPDWAEMAREADAAFIEGGHDGLDRWAERQRRDGYEATLFEDGRPLSGGHRPPFLPRLLPELLSGDSVEFRPRPDMRVVGQRVVGSDGVTRQLVAMRRPHPPPPSRELQITIQIVLSLMAIGGVGWWLARSISRPVAAVGDAARRFASGELTARVPDRWTAGRDEIGDLARDFDRMAARIEVLVTTERGVLQDVSHELRSPLARLHLLLDLAQRSSGEEAAQHFARAEQEIARLDRLIGEALALSRLEAELPGAERQTVDLTALTQRCIQDCELEAEAREVSIGFACGDVAIEVPGDAGLIGRALDNLLSNAIKFSDAGGAVQVALRREGAAVELSVRDHGPGVPEEEIATLFRPFFRGANAVRAEGHGLGLAIVERVARAHRGSVIAANAAGGGLDVVMRLPT